MIGRGLAIWGIVVSFCCIFLDISLSTIVGVVSGCKIFGYFEGVKSIVCGFFA